MASADGIAATSDGIRAVLDRAVAATTFTGLHIEHFGAGELQSPPGSSDVVVSVWLYRVTPSAVRRSSTQLVTVDGQTLNAPVLVDLYYLVTAWAKAPLLRQQLLGWAIRALDDTPVLPASLLNDGPWHGVFRATETVELSALPLTMQEEYDVWQVAQQSQQPSASYIVRGLELETRVPVEELPLVQTREWDYADEVPA
jgi:hypothetical protein